MRMPALNPGQKGKGTASRQLGPTQLYLGRDEHKRPSQTVYSHRRCAILFPVLRLHDPAAPESWAPHDHQHVQVCHAPLLRDDPPTGPVIGRIFLGAASGLQVPAVDRRGRLRTDRPAEASQRSAETALSGAGASHNGNDHCDGCGRSDSPRRSRRTLTIGVTRSPWRWRAVGQRVDKTDRGTPAGLVGSDHRGGQIARAWISTTQALCSDPSRG